VQQRRPLRRDAGRSLEARVWRRRQRPGEVGPAGVGGEPLAGLGDPLEQRRHRPGAGELRVAVAHDGAPGDEPAGPVLDHAEAVRQQRVRRAGPLHRRPRVGQLVTEPADDPGHARQRPPGRVQVLLDGDHPARTSSRHRLDR
jgi:hypothetical protein